MPESAARYFIKITAVSVERLQDISEEDCLREGITIGRDFRFHKEPYYYCEGVLNNGRLMMFKTLTQTYATLIDKINGKGTWNKNPYVWVYDFELINN